MKASFKQRRKTFVNNIEDHYKMPKIEISKILEDNGYRSDLRAEMLSLDDFIRLSDIFFEALK